MATHKEALKEAVKAWLNEDDSDGFVTAAFEDSEILWPQHAEAALRAYLDAMDAVIAPREATEPMITEGDHVLIDTDAELFASSSVYRAMLAAAPNPFKDEDNDR